MSFATRTSSLIVCHFCFCYSAPCGVVLDRGAFRNDFVDIQEALVATMGSSEDMEQVKRNPLLRARASLHQAIHHADGLESDALISARLSLCYVDLAFGFHQSVLALAKDVLETMKVVIVNSNTEPECVRRLHRRQLATASMYAAEASCALGDLHGASGFLSGEGADDSFDTLASNLSGITLEMAALSNAAKLRLAKAQTMVQSSLCALTSAMGNTAAAMEVGQSVNAVDDKSATTQERSSARRALIYTLLRENNQSSALSMLLS
jgi:hypothetical protein